MVLNCYVLGCRKQAKRDKNVRFFRFPAMKKNNKELVELSAKRRAAWRSAMKRKDLKESSLKYVRICSEHFVTGAPAHLKNELHPDWVPNLKMGYTQRSNSNARIKRFLRTENRQKKKEAILNSKTLVGRTQNVLPETSANMESHETEELIELDILKLETSANMESHETKELSELDILKLENEQKDKVIQQLEANLKAVTCDYQVELQHLEDNLKSVQDYYEVKLREKTIQIQRKTDQLRVKGMSIDDFKDNDSKVLYFTGLPSFTVLSLLFDYVKEDLASCMRKNINVFDAFMMTLLKLRLDLPFTYLSYKYCVSLRSISKIFRENIIVFNAKVCPLVHWPEKETLMLNTPRFFSRVLGNTFAAIIEYFEILIESPGDTLARCEVLSSKNHCTIKYLIAISPDGAISYVSKGYGGSCSDKTVIETSGFLNNIEEGDIILSDRVNKVVVEKGAKLLMPAFPDGNDQMAAGDIECTKNLAKLRIHMRSVINLLRQRYLILTNRQPTTAASKVNGDEMYFDYIIKSCCALVNLSPTVTNIECNE